MSKTRQRRVRHVSKKWLPRLRFLPCFFDVPVKYVHAILNVSHHTLDPMRRAFNLDRWPYSEVMNGKFYMTLEEISDLRTSMIPSADEPMRDILQRMSQCAEECKARNELPEPSERVQPKVEGTWPPNEDSHEFWEDISRIFELSGAAQEPTPLPDP